MVRAYHHVRVKTNGKGSIQTGRANVKSSATLLHKNYNASGVNAVIE